MFSNKNLTLFFNNLKRQKGSFHDISGDVQAELGLVRDQDNRMQFALKKEEMHSQEMFESV